MDFKGKLRDLIRWHLEPIALGALIRPTSQVALVDMGICLVPRNIADAGGVSYSVGVGEDIDFERNLGAFGTFEQWLFDPTPRSVQFMAEGRKTIPNSTFVPIGIWETNERVWFNAPTDARHVSHSITEKLGPGGFSADCRTISSVMADHRHTSIDLLKMNIEGAEDRVLKAMLAAGVRPRCIITTWEGKAALRKAVMWTRILKEAGWSFCGRKGWYFTYLQSDSSFSSN